MPRDELLHASRASSRQWDVVRHFPRIAGEMGAEGIGGDEDEPITADIVAPVKLGKPLANDQDTQSRYHFRSSTWAILKTLFRSYANMCDWRCYCRGATHVGHAQEAAHLSHFVLEELPQRLHQFKLQVLWQSTNVVMALDHVAVLLARAGRWAGLNDVRVQRALHQERRLDAAFCNEVVPALRSAPSTMRQWHGNNAAMPREPSCL